MRTDDTVKCIMCIKGLLIICMYISIFFKVYNVYRAIDTLKMRKTWIYDS